MKMVIQQAVNHFITFEKQYYLRVDYDIWLLWLGGDYQELHAQKAKYLEAKFQEQLKLNSKNN